MKRNAFRGGWYADCVSGGYAVLIPDSHIETFAGPVPLPPAGNALFLVCAFWRGAFVLACQGHQDGQAWLWTGSEWKVVGPTYGTSPVAFGLLGLYVSAPVAAANIRVLDPVTGAQTYAYTQPLGVRGFAAVDSLGIHSQDGWYGAHGLGEYVDMQGIYVGQGITGGCVINSRLLEPGDVQFIRAHRDGDNLAIAMWKPAEKQAVCVWLTVAEIVNLPLVVNVPPLPDPVPVPVPTPEPQPMPSRTVPMPPRVPQIVQALYERNVVLAEGDDDHRRLLIRLIAEQARFELGERWGTKDAGGGRPPSKDAIAYLDGDGTLYGADCFNGSTRKPSVPSELEELAGQHFIVVQPVNHLGAAPPPVPVPPTPEPPPMDDDLKALQAEIDDIVKRLTQLEQKPTPVPTLPNLKVRGTTSRDWGHSHRIDLDVTE